MALKRLKEFDQIDKNFEPLDNADTSDEHVMFNAGEVEKIYMNSQKIVEKFGDNIDRFTETITKITDTGIKGNSITLAIQNYKQKMKQAYNRVNDAKRDYSKAVLDRINLISNAEAKSANLLDGVNTLGSISSSVNSTMNEANDIIKWVNANSEFNNVQQTPQTTNNGIKFDGTSLNSWSESIK